jgi:RNA polymerase sigma factor (sigma-70 family)
MADEDESLTSDIRARPLSDSLVEELYRRERGGLVRLALLVTGSRAAAEDVVQDSFLRLRSTSAELSDPVRYLRRIVLNEARQVLRRREIERRHLPAEPGFVLPPDLDEMWQLLDGLSEKRRVALVLRYYEDLSFSDIARLMDCGENTARSLVHRGLKSLRRKLDADRD